MNPVKSGDILVLRTPTGNGNMADQFFTGGEYETALEMAKIAKDKYGKATLMAYVYRGKKEISARLTPVVLWPEKPKSRRKKQLEAA